MNRRDAIKAIAAASCVTVLKPGAAAADQTSGTDRLQDHEPDSAKHFVQQGGLQFWLQSSLHRAYPTSVPSPLFFGNDTPLRLLSGRNYRLSFQACVRNLETSSAQFECVVTDLPGIKVKVRRVGFVPMPNLNTYTPLEELEGIDHIPGLCPDPLYDETTAHIGPMGTAVFWISLFVEKSALPGITAGTVKISLKNRFGYMGWDNPAQIGMSLPFEVTVKDVEVMPRKDFPVTIWLSADSIWEHYKIAPFSERFWQLADAYIANLVDHGVNVIYTPIFNIRAEKLKRPAQLLRVKQTAADTYSFDFTDVRRWIKLAKKHGAEWVEFSHFFSPAPESAAYPQKIYSREDAIGDLLWPANTPATSSTYRKFLEQFLPQFKVVLEEEGMLEKSLFHLADEPDGEAAIARYRQARALLREVAPWIKVMDAMSDPHFATERLSDMPVPSIVTANQFTTAGCPAWVYYCCGPRAGYIQRLLDTPLWKIRMSGWLFYRLRARGFLHWGYNYWFKFCTDEIADPYQDASNGAWPGMPYGDTFAVYPGKDGPVDSVRWEVLAESLQDYALLQTAGVSPDDAMLKALVDYNEFPKDPVWVARTLQQVLEHAAKA